MATFNVLHVLAMFIAFAFTTGVGIYMTAIATSGDVRAIRTATKIARPFQIAGTVVFLLGIVFGFATASSVGFDLAARWLVISYILAGLLLVISFGVHLPHSAALAKAAAASPEDRASPELAAAINSNAARIAGPFSGLLWIGLIVMMVLRP